MNMKIKIAKILLCIIFLSVFNTQANEQLEERLMQNLQRLFPSVDISQVNATPIEDIYEVVMDFDVVYMTSDAKFILKGDMIDMQERRNLSEDVRLQKKSDSLKKIPEDEYIAFAPEKSKDTIYVFTDVSCFYCRKFHRDVLELNAHNITVKYLAYPRGDRGSPVYQQMVNVWCAKDRPQALTDAKNGKLAKANDCKNPVTHQHALGKAMGVRGTPALFLESGHMIAGYVTPDELLSALGR